MFPSLIASWTNDAARGRNRDGRRRPRVEALEDRALLSTFTVNNLTDATNASAGQTTLRMAIQMANANPGPDTVVLQPVGAYKLSLGELHVISPGKLTIQGALSPAYRVIDGQQSSRVFEVDAGCDVDFESLTIMNGRAAYLPAGTFQAVSRGYGGGLLNYGTVAMNHCDFFDNSADAYGGGLCNLGTAHVSDAAIVGNAAAYGGGVYAGNLATTYLDDCSLHGNGAAYKGGAIDVDGGWITDISDCGIFENSATSGGGIACDQGGYVTIQQCRIMSNVARANGGGLFLYNTVTDIRGTTIQNNVAYGKGGGIYSRGVKPTLDLWTLAQECDNSPKDDIA
jgi:predicted outer membrane repeat protein